MSIDSNSETERVICEELGRGHFRSIHELIQFGVQAWREHNSGQAQCRMNGPARAEEFAAWAKSRRPSPPLSDEAVGRASLNPDRW
jgi:hypothetical protein